MLRIIDAFSRINKMRAMHPYEKLLLCIMPVIILSFSRSAAPLIMNILVIVTIHIIIKNPIRIVGKFAAALFAFSVMSSIPLFFDYGINFCVLAILKALSGAMGICLLALTTPVEDVLLPLSKYKSLRNLCDIIKSMKRFLMLIEEEYQLLQRAMKSRALSGGLVFRIRNTGKVIGLLFVNTMRRWEDIKNAINSRGYKGQMSYLGGEFQLSLSRVALILFYNLIIISATIYFN